MLSYRGQTVPEASTNYLLPPAVQLHADFKKKKVKGGFVSVSYLDFSNFILPKCKINNLGCLRSLKFFPSEDNMDLGMCYVRFEVRLEKRVHTVQGLRKEVRRTNQTWERVWAEPQRRKESRMSEG